MDHQEAIDMFKSMTGVSDEEAKFFVESSKGDIDAAVSAYFDSATGPETEDSPMPGGSVVGNATASDVAPSASRTSSRQAKPKKPRGGFSTLGSLQQSDEDEDEDEKPAEFYTGGEKSGLGVIDPNKKQDGTSKHSSLIQDILKKAAAGGQASEEASKTSSSFRGAAYTLGGEEEESRKVEDPNESFRRAMASQPPKVTRILRLWKDGFSVDDGRLYRYDDPANKDYLEAINNGRAPLSLLNVEYGQAVDVNVEKRTDDDYTPPPKVYKPFESSGHRLGSETPPTETPVTTSQKALDSKSTESTQTMQIDDSQPTTTLQIRLAAGGRLVSQFNHSHTLSDVYDFIERSSSTSGRPFTLLTPFPRKEYQRDSTTLESAGLLKGVLQQKFA